jgi:hypothetical protein
MADNPAKVPGFGRDLITFISLRDVDCRCRAECRFGPPERLDIEKRTAEWRTPGSAGKIIEQAIDFSTKTLERPPRLQR